MPNQAMKTDRGADVRELPLSSAWPRQLMASFEVPGVVIRGLFKDPAGNPMGLVEMLDGPPKVP